MDKASAIAQIVRTGFDLVDHIIRKAMAGSDAEAAAHAARFKAYSQSVYDADRDEAEAILERRRAAGEIP